MNDVIESEFQEKENIISEAMKLMDEKKKKLLGVRNPVDMLAGSIDIDVELFKLAQNMKILLSIKYLAGTEATRFEKEYNYATMNLATTMTKEDLDKIGVVKSDKFKYIKTLLAEEYEQWETMKHKYRYFCDMYDCYGEWIMIYKKTRLLGAETGKA